nr:MAG TPA: hypothetical protein [Caudoviricetes sp.]
MIKILKTTDDDIICRFSSNIFLYPYDITIYWNLW